MNTSTDNNIAETLIELLGAGDEVDKCNAAKALGKIREPAARNSLALLLKDEDIDVCVDAATALGEIGDPGDAVALVESALGDPSGEVRVAAIEALGCVGGKEATDALVDIVSARPENLEMLEDGDWDPWWDMQLKAIRSLGRIGSESALPTLIGLLEGDESDDIESEVFNAFAKIGGPGEAYLISRLGESSSRQRRRIVRALPLCNTLEAWQALLGGLKDERTDVRVAALESLQRFPDLSKLEGLLMVLVRDPDPGVRTVSAGLLAGMDIEAADRQEIDSALSSMLSDSDAGLRQSALDGLLKRSSTDADSGLRAAVRERIGDSANHVTLTACRLVCAWQDDLAVAELRQLALDLDRDPGLRAEAIRALAGLSGEGDEIFDLLRHAAEDEAEPVRLAALSGLVKIDAVTTNSTAEAEGNLRPLELICKLVDPPPAATELEAEAVTDEDAGTTDSVTIVSQDEEISTDDGPSSTLDSILRDNERIAEDLGGKPSNDPFAHVEELDGDMVDYADIVKKTISERDGWKKKDKALLPSDMRHLAARVLGDSDDEIAIETLLIALAEDDADLRRDAADSLARIADRTPGLDALANAWGALVTHLTTDERSVRLGCVRALGALGKKKTVPVLTDALNDEDPSVRAGVIDALLKISSKYRADHPKRREATRQIQEKLQDPENNVRRTAALALLDLGDDEGLRAGLDSLIRSENSLGPAVRKKMNALQIGPVLEKQLTTVLAGCSSSTERRPVLECIGELFQKPSNYQHRLSI